MALLFPLLQFLDPNYTQYARPLALGYVYLYEAGTSTPKAAYVDAAESAEHANPIVLNSNGQPEVSGLPVGIWLASDGYYKIVIKNSAGTTLQTIDNVTGLGSTLTFFSTLNANLDTNGYSLVTSSGNKNITLQPNGTGKSKIFGLQPQDDVDMNGFNLGMDDATAIEDDSGNEYIKFAKTASAVNEITVTNQATGSNPQISATGGDTNIGLDFLSKGTGAYNFKGNASQAAVIRVYEDTDNGTNYSSIKPAESLSNNNGILTLPTVAMTCPTALPTQSALLTYSSAGAVSTTTVPSSGAILPVLTSTGVDSTSYSVGAPGELLGQLTSGNSYASTTILSSTTNGSTYRIRLPFGNYLSGSNNTTTLGIQLYYNGAYVTTNYNSYIAYASAAGANTGYFNAAVSSLYLDVPAGASPPYSRYFDITFTTEGNYVMFHGVTTGTASGSFPCFLTGSVTGLSGTASLLTGLKLIVSAGTISGGPVNVYRVI